MLFKQNDVFKEALPGQIGQLAKLETLNVSENQLIILPVQISQLKSLKTINLSQNRLNKIPSALYQLPQLDHLDLSKNRIQSIGDSKGGDAESQLEKLNCIELNLNENQVSYISPKLAQCPRLKVLRLEQNNLHLQAIPTSLLADSKVSLLSLDGNVFTPKQFESLEGYEKVKKIQRRMLDYFLLVPKQIRDHNFQINLFPLFYKNIL